MIVTLQEVKQFLRLEEDYAEEDILLTTLILGAESYIRNATGKVFNSSNNIAKLLCFVLISDWYENREFMQSNKVSDKVRYTVQSIILQLSYCYDIDTTESGDTV